MISQSLTAVVLPAGAGPGGSLRASIYLAPRLSGAHLLSEFPDWLHCSRGPTSLFPPRSRASPRRNS